MPFSVEVLEYFQHPRFPGRLEAPCGEGTAGSMASGVYARIGVRVEAGQILQARFQTYGCVPAIACCSYLTEWVTGRSVEEAATMHAQQLETALGRLPADRRFCAELAVQALQAALHQAAEVGCA